MSALPRPLNDDEAVRPPRSHAVTGSQKIPPVPGVLRLPVRPALAPQAADAEEAGPRLAAVPDEARTDAPADAVRPGQAPERMSSAEHDDAPGRYAWVGKLICLITAAGTASGLLLAIL